MYKVPRTNPTIHKSPSCLYTAVQWTSGIGMIVIPLIPGFSDGVGASVWLRLLRTG
jgi:hypothetical protein